MTDPLTPEVARDVRTKTVKELAEATAAMALDSLRAALGEEVKLRKEYREAPDFILHARIFEAEVRSNAAFRAWREANEAVP